MYKQRLVGFMVLGALAIVFWPILFVPPEPEQDLVLPVFEMPERPNIVMSKKQEPMLDRVDRSLLPVIDRATRPKKAEVVDEATANPESDLIAADNAPSGQRASRQRAEFDDQGLPVSWELQVATFSVEMRAEEIADQLRKKGHKAYVSPVTIGAQQLFRVRIGPNLQQQRLIEIQPDIDVYFGVESEIIKFEI